jgi:xanthine dehydrogenase accessory factor
MTNIEHPPETSTALDGVDLLAAASAWRRGGRAAALATVVNTWGSSPRPVGSLLAVDEAGHMIGSVSGGCVEAAVVSEAMDSIRDGKPRLLSFGVSDEQAWDVGLACGGQIRILVQRLDDELLGLIEQVQTSLAAHRPIALAMQLDGSERRLIEPGAGSALAEAAAEAVRADRSQTSEIGGEEWFIQLFSPPLRLVVVGAVHITQLLAPMARLAGYSVTVIDPRQAFATEARFPGIELLHQWPDKALTKLIPDIRTAVVTLTHDPKLDDPGLAAALRSECFYIGALGSRRTHTKRLERLAAEGFAPTELERICGPAGLDIGARSPGEIAVSVLAQVTQALRKRPGA